MVLLVLLIYSEEEGVETRINVCVCVCVCNFFSFFESQVVTLVKLLCVEFDHFSVNFYLILSNYLSKINDEEV